MNTIKILSMIFIVCSLISCKDDDDLIEGQIDFLIFGHFYGECFGETCIETYKLTDTQLSEDLNDGYSGTGPFDFVELGDEKFELVKDLKGRFPIGLLNEEDSTFGCPDCLDGGGLFLQLSQNSKIKSWTIDPSFIELPTYIQDFVDQVREKIDLINK